MHCSRDFLYSRRIVPEHLGGKFCRLVPQPNPRATSSPVKAKREKTLVDINTLQLSDCCRRSCGLSMTQPAMTEYRKRYRTATTLVDLLLLLLSLLSLLLSYTFLSSAWQIMKIAKTRVLQDLVFDLGVKRHFCTRFLTQLLGCGKGTLTKVRNHRHPFSALTPHALTGQP